jgi:hypothetical protein
VVHGTYGYAVPNGLAAVRTQYEGTGNWNIASEYSERQHFKISDDSRVGVVDVAPEAKDLSL